MTFIPDPNTLSVGDTVYLTRAHHIGNYGTFTVGHEFYLSSEYLQYSSASDGPSFRVKTLGHFEIFDIPKSDLSRVRP